MEQTERLLTVGELAEALQVPKSWIYTRTRVNAIPCVRLGKYVRFRLDSVIAHLEREGGHVGYDIRPSERNRGYGTEILRLTLEEARVRNIVPILVTCDDDNIASIRVIEKNGGRLVGNAISEISGKRVLRYHFAERFS